MSSEQESSKLIEFMPTDILIPSARNARKHNDEQVAQIASSIKEFGFCAPVLIDSDNGIIAGHGRVMAARVLRMDTVPCLRLSHLTEAQRRAYVIVDNRLTETGGGWDDAMLAIELADLKLDGFDLDLIGFDADELNRLLDGETGSDEGSEGPSIDGNYSRKIKAPIYEIKGDKPAIKELYDDSKARDLIAQIDQSDIPDDVADFLRHAARRHTVFNFGKIAEFYAHADSDTQDLMEQSALIIIDFNKAIECGFVKLSEEIAKLYAQDYGSSNSDA